MYLRLFIALATVLVGAILIGVFAVSFLLVVLVLLPLALIGLWITRRIGPRAARRTEVTVIEGEYRVEEPDKLPPERRKL